MNDFEGLLASDFGFKPSGKSAPLSSSASASTKGSANLNPNFDLGSLGQSRSARTSNSYNGSLSDDRDSFFGLSGSQKSQDFSGLGDILGGSMRYSSKSETRGADTAFNFDSMFGTGAKSSTNSEPVFDKPVYDDDDDIFDGVPGLKSSSSKVKHDDDFSSVSSLSGKGSSAFDDLLGGFGKSELQSKSFGAKGSEKNEKVVPAFDDLLPGFGGSSIYSQRSGSGANFASENTIKVNKSKSNVMDDPFVVTGDYNDPLEEISKLSNSGSMKKDSSVDNGSVYDDMDPFGDLGKSIPVFSSERNNRGKERNTEKTDSSTSGTKTFYSSKEPMEKPSVRSPDSQLQKKVHIDNDWDSRQTMFDMSTASTDSHKHTSQNMSPPSYASASFRDENVQGDRSIRYEEKLDSSEYVWLTVSDIPLFTQPTTAPPPSRPPPPRPVLVSKAGSSSPASTNARRKLNEFSSFPNSSQNSHIPRSDPASARTIDHLEDFVTGRSQDNVDEHGNVLASEGLEMNSAAAAMKEAMDRAETKFRHAKEVREREGAEAARSRETQVEKDDKEERWDREQLYREREEEEMEQRKLEREREREEEQRELRKLENGRERARQIEKEREKARQAVERATREARERAAAEARLRADRAKAEKAAVERANAEARERAERAAVQRAQAEARERAAAEARGRAEKAASDRANAEAKEREACERAAAAKPEAEAHARAEQRAAVERAAAEARKRAAAESRGRAAAAARASQQKSENDLEAFFGMGRASSAPRPRANSSTKQQAEMPKASSVSSSNTRKASSTANIVDDLSSIFGAAPSSGDQDFQEVEGESEERQRARLERHQRTHERAARALAEKNERDLQNQREQAERSRIGETLDAEVRRWASGKEGNLRALLSTLQYVLWLECGWQPVSLTDMITAASVKKVYRKATLCIHPDKVQQKGANLQQKYVAEKVFDLLKEAWNKFNSEELF